MTADVQPPGRAWGHPRSIATRLTVLFTLSTGVLLALTALAHYLTLADSLAARDQAAIAGKIGVLALLLRDESDQTAVIINEVEHEAAENQAQRYFLRVLASTGQLIVETSEMRRIVPVAEFPIPDTPARRYTSWESRRQRVFLLQTARARSHAAQDPDYVLQVALEITSHEELLVTYRRRMLISVCIGTAVAAGLGVLVARDALQPLRAIARSLRRITANRLDQRLSPGQWPQELRDLAGSCNTMLDRLQDSFDRLSQFSADLAHELRTPIGNLRGETEVALSRARDPGEYQQVLASSMEELERLSRMIEGLLFLARAEDPRTVLSRAPLDARREMAAVRDFFEAMAAERRVSVACHGDARFTGDAMLVRRALSNLVSNALRHTPTGGKIELLATQTSDGAVAIVVRDTGSGIPTENLPHVFDRFYRVEQSRTDSAEGSGLGLAIVLSIMRQHGGDASIVSTVGVGTSVTLSFPAVR